MTTPADVPTVSLATPQAAVTIPQLGFGVWQVPDDEARALHAALAARLSGYLVPKLVREVAGDSGKRPL